MYARTYYAEEITGESEISFVVSFIRAHGGQYTVKTERRNHRNNAGIAWCERVYTINFMLYPHEYEAMLREM